MYIFQHLTFFYLYIYVPLLHLKQNTYIKNLLLFVKINNTLLTMKFLQVYYLFKGRTKDLTFSSILFLFLKNAEMYIRCLGRQEKN